MKAWHISVDWTLIYNASDPMFAFQVLEDAKKMSKRQKKRLVQIQERKAKEARRAALYQTLEEQKMSEDHLKLLRSTKDYTQKVGGHDVHCVMPVLMFTTMAEGCPLLDTDPIMSHLVCDRRRRA